MRLLARKYYRAFPELDRYSDAECRQFAKHVARLDNKPGIVAFVLRLLAIAAAGLTIIAIVVPLIWLGTWFADFLRRSFAFGQRYIPLVGLEVWEVVQIFLQLGPPLIVTAYGQFVWRDFFLKRALRRRIEYVRCPKCRQSLIGLPISDAGSRPQVRCTECGERHDLAEMGLAPADLIPQEHSARFEVD